MSDVTHYLRRLGLEPAQLPARPSAAGLAALHAAHVERVPFETLDRPDHIDTEFSVRRIAKEGRGGVCYHLNGAFQWLLTELGYTATLHPAGTQSRFAATAHAANGTHVVLIVSGLPDESNSSGRWVADVGAGEGFHRPLPLLPGRYRQGSFSYHLRPSDLDPTWWRFDYDPRESCQGVDFSEQPVTLDGLRSEYHRLATEDMAIFFRYGWVKRHTAQGYDQLIGCQFSRVDESGRSSETVIDEDRYFARLRETFRIDLTGLTAADRASFWNRIESAWNEDEFTSTWQSV